MGNKAGNVNGFSHIERKILCDQRRSEPVGFSRDQSSENSNGTNARSELAALIVSKQHPVAKRNQRTKVFPRLLPFSDTDRWAELFDIEMSLGNRNTRAESR